MDGFWNTEEKDGLVDQEDVDDHVPDESKPGEDHKPVVTLRAAPHSFRVEIAKQETESNERE
jgi:hypothetical protein